MYRPFINDPAHISLLDGQRYVVLRARGAVAEAYAQFQRTVKERLAGLDVSYPAQPHATLVGLGQGTAVDAVRDLVSDWAKRVPPLHLDIERVGAFPTPFQIVIMQIRRTPELARAMASLRELVRQRGLTDLAKIAPADWTFHLSVAYCSSLSTASWAEVDHWVASLAAPTAQGVVSEAEIVVFDGGQESSGGASAFTGSAFGAAGPGAV